MLDVSFTDRHAPARAPAGPQIPPGVRSALLDWLSERDVSKTDLWRAFARLHGFGSVGDIVEDIRERWGDGEADAFREAVNIEARSGERTTSESVIRQLPAPLFLDALESAIEILDSNPHPVGEWEYDTYSAEAVAEINRLFERRGIDYRFTADGKAEWHGDREAYEQLVAPALAALDDPRLAAAAEEFRDSLVALRKGDRIGDKNAIRDASNAVESAMKALLDAHGIKRPEKESADNLWQALADARIVSATTREMVCAAPHLGNKYGRHGPEPDPDPVPEGTPTLAVHCAAAALIYLAGLLPGVGDPPMDETAI